MLCLLLSIVVHNDCKTPNRQKYVTEAKFYLIRLNIAFFTLWDYHNLNGHVLFQKSELNKEEKKKIAKYAASLIAPDDFVYLDAGTTTGLMLEYLAGVRAAFVTNAVSHAQTLAKMGIRVYLIGGELKSSTEAVVGSQAMQMIQMYHFTKGFFGTNGITRREGFTTPDTSEAIVKSTAMKQCKDVYILTDKSKFGEVSSVTFGGFTDAKILTEEIPEEYEDSKNILKVK